MKGDRTLESYIRDLSQKQQAKSRDVHALSQHLANLQQARQDQLGTLRSSQDTVRSDDVLHVNDLTSYYENYYFINRQISALQKEELDISRRIEECRAEIVSMRQSHQKIHRLVSRRNGRQQARRLRLDREEWLALGVARTSMLGEGPLSGVPIRISSVRVSGHKTGKDGEHPGN